MTASGLPFEGITVVDLSRVLAGPTVTRLLVEYGASIVKVEAAPHGDVSRHLPYLRDGRSGYFIQANRGKRSVCLDYRHPRGPQLLFDLARSADVVVENFRPGVMDELGLSWDRLHRENPRLVLCSVTALGHGGPLSSKPGYDTIGAALSGIAATTGVPGGPPMMPSAAIGDTMTGVHGFAGVATALYRRERTGLGDWVQVSLLDSYIHSHEINIQALSGSRGAIDPGPRGAGKPPVAPIGFYLCGGRYLFIACVQDSDWRRMAQVLGHPELGDDARYATNEDRVEHHAELDRLVRAWLEEVGDPAPALERLESHGVCAELVHTVSEAVRHPHNVARRAVRTVPDDRWGEITIPGVPIRFASVPEEAELHARELGADNEEVLAELLGLDGGAIDELYRDGLLHRA